MFEIVRQLGEDAAKAAASSLWSLPDGELLESLHVAYRLQQTAAVLTARLVAEAAGRDVPAGRGHRSLPGWLRAELLLDTGPARELAEQATFLTARPGLCQAVLDGALDLRQAQVISAAVAAIPATLASDGTCDSDGALDAHPGPDTDMGAAGVGDASAAQLAEQAEAVLVDMAAQFPAGLLRRLGERILAHVAPEIADRADEAALRRQEARAHRRRGFTLSPPHDGMIRLTGALTAEDAAVVAAALHPLCMPTSGDTRTPAQRRADALIDVCRLALRTRELPDDGGEPPQVTVTIPFDPLVRRLGIGTLDTGDRVSAATARRMACDARVLPIVLGGAGQVLDAGRTRRLATGALRRALVARDRGCTFPGCDRPSRWTDGHHLTPWSQGGPTRLDNLTLLCPHHHRLIHDPAGGWTIQLGSDGLPDFLPPPWIDPLRQPRRNLYHLRT